MNIAGDMMKAILAFLLLFFVQANAFCQTEMPPEPDGFHWKTVDEVKFSFLHPDGWYFKSEVNGNTFAFFSTKEEITPTQDFSTGLTVNVVRHVKQDTDQYIEKFFNTYKSQNSISFSERTQFGPFKAIRFATTKKFDNGTESTIFNFIVSNKTRGTIFMVIFESPASEWESEWETGKVILSNLGLDDEI